MRRFGFTDFGGSGRNGSAARRDQKLKARALARSALDGNPASMSLRDRLCDREAQPQPRTARTGAVGSEKALKDVRQGFRRDALTVVLNGQPDTAALGGCGNRNVAFRARVL